ncbi:hypothetical protein D9615_003564 [Tricholomella constricta]|uniref:Alcohol acetyltransferase n=1 Tax=Tricholomella constricta TaxID=117010 RepID=A0A8H5HID3_9AGAR|nr:hypothetical protein D9615_003564 [Tricholomella constricta]
MEERGEIVRPAGLLERYHIVRHSVGLDSCVLNAAQYIHPENHRLEKGALFQALRKVVQLHPALGIRLARELSPNPSFERLQIVDLAEIVEFSDSCGLKATIEAQLLRPFNTASALPLWRVVVMKDDTICFAWHHCIGDGMSGLAFHRTLQASLEEGEDHTPAANYTVLPSRNTFTPAIEEMTSLTPSWGKVVLEIFELFAPTAWTRGASAWTGNPVKTDISLTTRVLLIEFAPDEVSALLNICRSHKATLTSAFQTMAISVLSSLIPAEKHKTISSYVPISLRGIAGTPSDVFCDHVSTLHSYPRINATFSWVEAAQYASRLRSYTPQSVEEIGMIRFLFGKYASFFKGKLGKKRQGGIEISNVGRFEAKSSLEAGPTWSIGRMVFAQCDAVLGAALKLNVVGDSLGGVTVAVTWGAGAIPDSFAEEFTSRFKVGIDRLLKATSG